MRLKERAITLIFASIASIAMSAFAAEPEAVPGEYIVKMREGFAVNKASARALSNILGSQVKSTIPSFNMVVVKRAPIETTKSVVNILSENPGVEYVEPNYIYHASRTPNDPLLGRLWGMNNTTTAGVDVDALRAWDIETGNPNLVVAVVDTGVDYTHPDLAGNIWTNEAEANGVTGVDDDGNGVIDDIHGFNAITGTGDPLDDHGHGSHCSGTIGAKGDDGKGIVGVNWNVKIMGAKFLSKDGSGSTEGAIKAIDYANKMGAKVLSNSWGGGGFSQALLEAIQRTNASGAVFVAAAGNESNNNDANASYPASYDVPNIISVAAIDNKGRMASFSNYGKTKVHVAAPGVDIMSSTPGGKYDTWSGTSMATPHVSGIAALLISHEPNITNVEVKQRIMETARKAASLRNKVASAGIATAYGALTREIPGPDMNDPFNWQATSVTVSTPHPYADKFKNTYTVSVPGANQIALYFEKFQTESGFDVAIIKDSKGNVVDKISGNLDDTFSATITGDSATVEFSSDDSVTRYGFDITKAAYR